MARKKPRAKGLPKASARRPQSPLFSLADEARFTSNHRSTAFDFRKKLRHMPISFVSAGFLEGTIKEKSCPLIEPNVAPPSPLDPGILAQMTLQGRSASPSVSSRASNASSEEVIVFRGRGPMSANAAPVPSAVPPPMATKGIPSVAALIPTVPPQSVQPSAQPSAPSFSPATGDAAPRDTLTFTPRPAADEAPVSDQDESETESDGSGVNDAIFKKRRGGRPIWEGKQVEWIPESKSGIRWLPKGSRPARGRSCQLKDDHLEAAMDDYMQNTDAFDLYGEMSSTFARRELDLEGGSHNDWNKSDAEHDMLLDVNDRSTGSRLDEGNYTTSSEGGDGEVGDENSEEADEEELGDEVDDEMYARILQKQEELGLGSDELVLYASKEYFGRVQNTLLDFDRPNKKRQHRSGGGWSTGSFPSASAMADALDMDPYGAFDIMDTDRPSLRPVKKGRRGQMPPELEDSDLNDTLQATWRADRDKKRLKKVEREELRRQGLLGRKGKAPDLRVKYKDGVDMVAVMDDVRVFLMSEMQTLALPPMEAHRRAIVHQIVRSLGINSKSRGDGEGRFTVLSRTRRSTTPDIIKFDERISKTGLQRRLRAAGTSAHKGKKNKGATPRPAVGYKDGDVVGALAPELGPENRGHGLMKKMGWSKGMALGAHDNKGILHPIAHTVKTTKAGLQ